MILSIIIPTKNRYTTLFSVVEMILSFDLNDDIEIVIQDNTDDNKEALDFIAQRVKYSNLKYFHSSENLSVIGNSDKAVLNSTGEYVCFIGDDDGVMPNIVKVVKWMKENGFKGLKSVKPHYYWPGQRADYFNKESSGVLTFGTFKNNFTIINCAKALHFTLSRGGTTIKMLPCVYHGIIERKVLDEIYTKTGSFFPGPSPDMANAIALTKVLKEFIYVEYPVIISGKCKQSTGGSGVLHKHVAKIEDVAHLPRETSINWNEKIPKYWTGPTIWAESVLKTLEKFNDKISMEKFNFSYLYAYLTVFNFEDSKQIYRDFQFKKNINYFMAFFRAFQYRAFNFINNRLFKKESKKFYEINDIKQAVNVILENSDSK